MTASRRLYHNELVIVSALPVNDGLKTNETCRFENHVFRNLSADSSCPVLGGVKANPDQAGSALNARGIHSKKEESLALNPEENATKNTAKPWFSNRQLSTGFGTMLRPAASALWQRTVYRAPPMGGPASSSSRSSKASF